MTYIRGEKKMTNRKFIESKMLVPKYGKIENYVHTPIVKHGESVGVITKAEELSDAYLITYFNWDKPVISYTDNGGLLSIDIS